MDRGVWWATVHRDVKNKTWLSDSMQRGMNLNESYSGASYVHSIIQNNRAINQKLVEHDSYMCYQQRQFSLVTQLCPTLWPHRPQYARLPCPSLIPRACSNPCPSSQWCHPNISSSVVPFSSCHQGFPASGSLPRSRFFTTGGHSIALSASASVLPMNTQDRFKSFLQHHSSKASSLWHLAFFIV